MNLGLLSSINNITQNTTLRNKVEDMDSILSGADIQNIIQSISNEDLIHLLAGKSYTTLIIHLLDYISWRLEIAFEQARDNYFNAELTLSRLSEEFGSIRNQAYYTQAQLQNWKDNKDNILDLITNLQQIEEGTSIENKIIIAIGSTIYKNLLKMAEERGLNGVVKISALQELSGCSRNTVLDHLMHYGLISEESDIKNLTWNEEIFKFIAYLKVINGMSDGERKNFIDQNSVIYRRIRAVREQRQVSSRSEYVNFSAYYFTLDDLFIVLKKLELIDVSAKDLEFKRSFRFNLAIWERLYKKDVAVDGSTKRELLFFSLEGALTIINYVAGGPVYKSENIANLFIKKKNPGERHIELEKANFRLAHTLDTTLVLMESQPGGNAPINQRAISFINSLTDIKTDVSEKVVMTDEIDEMFAQGYRIDPNQADQVIIEFLRKLIFNPDRNVEDLIAEYGMHFVFYNLIQVYTLAIELDQTDHEEAVRLNPSNPPKDKKLRQKYFKKVFRLLFPAEFEELEFKPIDSDKKEV